jgi:hypothetical protein
MVRLPTLTTRPTCTLIVDPDRFVFDICAIPARIADFYYRIRHALQRGALKPLHVKARALDTENVCGKKSAAHSLD